MENTSPAAPAENRQGEWRTYGGRGDLVSRMDGWTPTAKMSDSKRARLIANHDESYCAATPGRSHTCRDCGDPLRAWEGHGHSGQAGYCHDCE